MGRRDLPDMYVRSPRAAGPRTEGIHIRELTIAHVTSYMYHFQHAKNLPKPIKTYACSLYIAIDAHCDCMLHF